MITILSGLELQVQICAFGIGGEEGSVLRGGHIEVLIDLSTLSKFQFQHLLLRSIADAAILLESTETRCMLSWMRTKLRTIRCGERAVVSFMPVEGSV